jgi:peptidoglycan/xylan/chitin deacetylase (PgdA/CDA1 family)
MSKYSISVLIFVIIETLLAVLYFSGILNVYPVIISAVFYVSLLSYSSFSISSCFYLPVICRGGGIRKEVALTFDDGPLEKYTPEILDILKIKTVKAAFFCTGKTLQSFPDIVRRIVEEGHIIGNHTWTHSSLFDFYSAERMSREISGTTKLIETLSGSRPRFFRPPFGVTNPHLAKALKNSGLIAIGWTFRTFDTMIKDRRKLIDRTISRLADGAILTFHDYNKTAVDILPELIDSIRNKGYAIVSLHSLIEEKPYE